MTEAHDAAVSAVPRADFVGLAAGTGGGDPRCPLAGMPRTLPAPKPLPAHKPRLREDPTGEPSP